MLSLLSLPLAVLLDRFLGEPPRYHPLVGFGNLANKIEAKFYQEPVDVKSGIIAWSAAVIPIVLLVALLDYLIGGLWLSVLCGWLAIGWQSLKLHAQEVQEALQYSLLDQAQEKVGHLVSRNTQDLDENGVSTACIESVLENGSDAIFAPLFWLVVAGAPGVVLYRLANTLDAMWGYRNERYEKFGKAAARIDDVLNYIPARLTALAYAIMGNSKPAFTAWYKQASQWYSPNAGVVMATGAGALSLQLGGSAHYDNELKERPTLGEGKEPETEDIGAAIELIDKSLILWMSVCVFVSIFLYAAAV